MKGRICTLPFNGRLVYVRLSVNSRPNIPAAFCFEPFFVSQPSFPGLCHYRILASAERNRKNLISSQQTKKPCSLDNLHMCVVLFSPVGGTEPCTVQYTVLYVTKLLIKLDFLSFRMRCAPSAASSRAPTSAGRHSNPCKLQHPTPQSLEIL